MPKISVIVPVYRVEPYLHRCVDSILAQTFSDFELILVDDGSPDNCPAICDEYAKKDNRFKVIHRKQNGGASAARNLGLKTSQGEYICFIDSDDYVVPEYLETLLQTIEETQADIVQCGYYEVIDGIVRKDERERFLESYTSQQAFGLLYGDGRNDILDFVMCNKIYKKDMIKDLCFVEGLRCEDAIYISEIMMRVKKVSVSNRPIYYYCRHDDSVMGQMQKEKDDLIMSHILAYRQVAMYAETNASDYMQKLSNARLAAFYVSAIKNNMLKGNKQLKAMLKEDKKRFSFLKNKRIPFIKRLVLAIGS